MIATNYATQQISAFLKCPDSLKYTALAFLNSMNNLLLKVTMASKHIRRNSFNFSFQKIFK